METQVNYPQQPNNSSSANTVLLVVIILALVFGGWWWYTHRGGAPAPANDGGSINVDVNLPQNNPPSGGASGTVLEGSGQPAGPAE